MDRSAAFIPEASSSWVPTSVSRQSASAREPDLPGCEPFPLPANVVDDYDGRFEYWDRRTETAWRVSEPTSIWHEQPTRRLTRLAERVASLRGSPIECFGSADLLRLDADGGKRWIMQADEILYLHPGRARLSGPAVVVGEDALPDVVLEVDHSTDVRRWKLGVYQECGFPEIWVAVPWDHSSRRPGLTIHVRGDAGYAEASESRAFPGLDGVRHPSGPDRGADLHRDLGGARAGGAGDGPARGDDPGRRSDHALGEPAGGGEGARGRRAGDASPAGHRRARGPRRGRAAHARSRARRGPGRGPGVHRCRRLPAVPAGSVRCRAVTALLAMRDAPWLPGLGKRCRLSFGNRFAERERGSHLRRPRLDGVVWC